MKHSAGAHFVTIGIVGLMLAGCGHNASNSPHAARASSPTPAPQVALASNLRAFQAAATGCQKTTPPYTTTLSPACAKVADAALTVRRQYAAGIEAADTASMAMQALYVRNGKLPTTNVAAGLAAPDVLAGTNSSDNYVGSVAIGPVPGVITVTWAHGVLAGDKLVAAPAPLSHATANLCWQVDAADTTVPKITQQLGPELTNGCN